MPRRHANLLRQVVGTEDRAPLVGPRYNKRAANARRRAIDNLMQIPFPGAGNARRIELALPYEAVDDRAAAKGPDDHCRFRSRSAGVESAQGFACCPAKQLRRYVKTPPKRWWRRS